MKSWTQVGKESAKLGKEIHVLERQSLTSNQSAGLIDEALQSYEKTDALKLFKGTKNLCWILLRYYKNKLILIFCCLWYNMSGYPERKRLIKTPLNLLNSMNPIHQFLFFSRLSYIIFNADRQVLQKLVICIWVYLNWPIFFVLNF